MDETTRTSTRHTGITARLIIARKPVHNKAA
jgi:hypothetical protein